MSFSSSSFFLSFTSTFSTHAVTSSSSSFRSLLYFRLFPFRFHHAMAICYCSYSVATALLLLFCCTQQQQQQQQQQRFRVLMCAASVYFQTMIGIVHETVPPPGYGTFPSFLFTQKLFLLYDFHTLDSRYTHTKKERRRRIISRIVISCVVSYVY